jgi:hypothetical protein
MPLYAELAKGRSRLDATGARPNRSRIVFAALSASERHVVSLPPTIE